VGVIKTVSLSFEQVLDVPMARLRNYSSDTVLITIGGAFGARGRGFLQSVLAVPKKKASFDGAKLLKDLNTRDFFLIVCRDF
jgi:transcription elongation factor